MAAASVCGVFANVVGQSDAGGLEDIVDLAGDVGPRGDDLAALFDGCLLEPIEIVQQLLPFGLEAPGAAQAVQLLGEGQGQEGTENVAADRGVSLVKDRPGRRAGGPALDPGTAAQPPLLLAG